MTPEPVALPSDSAEALRIGAALIRQFESYTLTPLPDARGRWQIGYGCDFLPDGTPVTQHTPPLRDIAEAEAMMQAKLAPLASGVDQKVTAYLLPCARGALYDFAWNLGLEALATSTLLRLVNAGDMQGAADQFLLWDKVEEPNTGELVASAGLTRRRAVERAVFLGLTTI